MKRRGRGRPTECDSCGERTRRVVLRGGLRACRDCRRLTLAVFEAANAELERIRAKERSSR